MKRCWPACFLLPAVLGAQSYTVSNTSSAGAGSLREAIFAANAAGGMGFRIDIAPAATLGPIVVTSSALPQLTAAGVLVQGLPGHGRLVVDARAVTATGAHALDLRGAGIRWLVPTRVLVQRGLGMSVRGTGTTIADLEAVGGGEQQGLLVSADAVTLGRLSVDGFQQGLLLQGCRNARLAAGATDPPVLTRNCTQHGIAIVGGGDHVLGSFTCEANAVGIVATGASNLELGRSGGLRSRAAQNSVHGVQAIDVARCRLVNADLAGNGIGGAGGYGLVVDGGSGLLASDADLPGNGIGGILLVGNCTGVRLGPNVTTSGRAGDPDLGLAVRAATGVSVVACRFGPAHQYGVLVGSGGGTLPSEVTLSRCLVAGNLYGVEVNASRRVLVHESTITQNQGTGLHAVQSIHGAPNGLAIVASTIGDNAGNGILARTVTGLVVGPGNRVDDNRDTGIALADSPGAVIRDNPSVQRNRGGGIELLRCAGASVARTRVTDNPGIGLWVLHSDAVRVGPALELGAMLGTGIKVENSQGTRIESSRISQCSGAGVHYLRTDSVVRTTPNVLRSVLCADNGGVGVLLENGPPLRCELSTIAGNLRGCFAAANPLAIESSIVRGNLLEDLHQAATATTVQRSFFGVPAPAPGNPQGNSAADPQFVAAGAGDYRVLASSPAVGAADPALAVQPSELDAFDGPRRLGALDCGAYEVGPHAPSAATTLELSAATMAVGGGGLACTARYPAPAVGLLSVLLLQLGPATGPTPLLGASIPLGATPDLLLAATDSGSTGTFALVPADGVHTSCLLWAGRLSPNVVGQLVSLCVAAVDGSLTIRAVSNVATFTIQ